MGLSHWLAAGSLLFASCASNNSATDKRRERTGDAVHALVQDAAQKAGLGPLESRMAAGAAEKLAKNPEKLQSAVDRAEEYLAKNPKKSQKYKQKARKFLQKNPQLKEVLGDLVNE